MGYLHEPTNLWIRGAIDDLWVNPAGEVIVVDYKATSSATKEPSLDDDWKIQYKRQADVYQWLARRQGLKVSDTAYFVCPSSEFLGQGAA
jgi:RecB family exonuclease